MKTYIYSLDCPITGLPKYIGKTINPKQRLAQHIRSNENTKKYAWIKGLKNLGLKPNLSILESFESDYDFWENWYIEYYKFLGIELKNHKGGGVGGRLSKETKNKISAKLKGKKKTEEHRVKCIKNLVYGIPWNKGITLSKENRDKAVKALEGYRNNGGLANAKINEATARLIKIELSKKENTHVVIANKFNVTKHIVKDINRNKTWKNIKV
jgi:hypothetical protein